MSQIIEVKVPDIGDFESVPVIELYVKVGDSIKLDDAICTLESDKATMDVPSTAAGVVTEVVEALSGPAKEKGLALSFNTKESTEVLSISVDRSRLKQVLMNLVGNAVKYTPKGEIVVRQYKEGDRAVLRVSDTGLGMSAEEQKRLFEKFYRISTEQTKDIRGTGLGLWITARIVKEMKGTITVK